MDHRPEKGKLIRKIILLSFLGLAGFFSGRYVLYTNIKNTIEAELASLSKQGVYIQYGNLEVNPWAGGIVIYKLSVKVRKDSLANDGNDHGLEADLPYVEIKGIELIPFIRNKTLAIRNIFSNETNITYSLGSALFKNEGGQKRKIELKNISVAKVDLPDIDIYLTGAQGEDTVAHILTDVNMRDLLLAKQLDSVTWRQGKVNVSNFAMNYIKEFYGVAVQQINLDISNRILDIDSILLKPVVSRSEFMKIKGKQVNFMDVMVPHLKIRSIYWYTYPTPTLQMDYVAVSLNTSMYRDKRLPFEKRPDRTLPSHFIQRLPFRIKIDTVKLTDSFVSYEEMPEHGDSTGLIYFKDLNATILNIHNNSKLKVNSTMAVNAKFMGAGILNAHFIFPYDTLNPYRVTGTLRQMPLTRINNILGATAQVKVETGIMQNFKFNFTYNKVKSKGMIELNYDNLKIQTLRQNKDNEQSVDYVKSILLNAFIVRKDMDEKVKDEKRQGEIEFYRDTQRSVFNYWWKSLLSGIKSAYNLDKLPLNPSNQSEKKDKKKRKSLKQIWSKIFNK